MLNVGQCLSLLAEHLASSDARRELVFEAVVTDSRKVPAGALFIALRGEHFDGHAFLGAAAAAGARGALVDRSWCETAPQPSLPADFALISVDDTRRALGSLAAGWRAGFDLPLIGITGSNGKTTVKEMCAAILSAGFGAEGADRTSVLATAGNFNNEIGLPLTLLGLRPSHRAAVIEMGMNRPGEIARLSAWARPTVALVTNAQRAHLAGMGTVEEVAAEKAALYDSLGAEGVAIINVDDSHAEQWRTRIGTRQVLGFGCSAAADVRVRMRPDGTGQEIELETPQGRLSCRLALLGHHNALNAAAAAAACLAAGVGLAAVEAGLSSFAAVPGRLQAQRLASGALIIDDSYNANPDSVQAAIEVLAALPGRSVLVLGDMGEVGAAGAQLHDELGGLAKSKGIDRLFALGEMAALAAHNFGEGGRHFKCAEALVKALQPMLDAETVVLVKGSRFMGMEKVAAALIAVHNSPPAAPTGA